MISRALLRTSPRPIGRYASAIRPYHATVIARFPTTGPSDSPAPGHSATASQHGATPKGNTTSPTASASQHNAPKDPKQDAAEAEAAAPGPEAMDGQYGGGNLVEGNYTKGSKQQKERAEAAKQGEK
ncbi:hypothetical protein JCM10908_003508 [Rhodotorula pacifica]|uniref:uncharacterized protein n=1 Tax=Rhodotorula pacifica TaxID=1495444 RepID=UPI003180D69C